MGISSVSENESVISPICLTGQRDADARVTVKIYDDVPTQQGERAKPSQTNVVGCGFIILF